MNEELNNTVLEDEGIEDKYLEEKETKDSDLKVEEAKKNKVSLYLMLITLATQLFPAEISGFIFAILFIIAGVVNREFIGEAIRGVTKKQWMLFGGVILIASLVLVGVVSDNFEVSFFLIMLSMILFMLIVSIFLLAYLSIYIKGVETIVSADKIDKFPVIFASVMALDTVIANIDSFSFETVVAIALAFGVGYLVAVSYLKRKNVSMVFMVSLIIIVLLLGLFILAFMSFAEILGPVDITLIYDKY